jgi:hypothetical protein
MMVCAFVLKPDAILPNFRDRIRVQNAINAMAWPYHVRTKSARGVCPRTNAGRSQRRWQSGRTLPLPEDRVSARPNRRSLWKATCPAIWQCGIKSSMPLSVYWAARLTTFCLAAETNNMRSASQLAVSAASIARENPLSAQWRRFNGIPQRTAA